MIVSIVTICKDNPEELYSTIESYHSYLGCEVESVIIDGSVDDACLSVCNNYGVRYFKQTSSGIYGAMNEGVELCLGTSVIFMNSGDVFSESFDLNEFVRAYEAELSNKIIFGNSVLKYKDYTREFICSDRDKIGIDWIPTHQSVFMPHDFLVKNKFDESFKVSADSKLQMLAFERLKYIYVCENVCVFTLGGISSKPTCFKKTIQHCSEIIKTRGLKSKKSIFYLYFKQLSKVVVIRVLGYRLYLKAFG